MNQSVKRSLTDIFKKDHYFKEVMHKLTLDTELTNKEKSYILSSALIFLQEYDKNKSYKSYVDIAYYIILKYSIRYSDYKPLFDISNILGYFPISDSIIKNELLEDFTFVDFTVKFKIRDYENNNEEGKSYIETFEQNKERIELISDSSQEKGFLAPTSFGKSSVMIEFIKSLKSKKKIAIIVPTKSLLMQTYKMIREARLDYRILMHNEMYNDDESFIGVFTQERALRLNKTNNVFYDVLIIDEAHNIFDNNNRSLLLARLIRLNKSKNENTNIVYLSPLINEINNLNVNREQAISSHTINFNIKSPELYEYTTNDELLKHNRFFINDKNKGLFVKDCNSYLDLIKQTIKNKNFFYNYRPIYIEQLSKELLSITEPIENNRDINEIVEILKNEVHEQFYSISLIKHGIVYLHGKLPDLIKEYLEKKFKDIACIKYVVANSVILEGMNLPIDNLYIFNSRGLNGKDLTNLIGRVNRLNEIFKNGNNLNKLLPQVYFVNNENYNKHGDKTVNMFNKIKLLRNRTFSDEVNNPLLDKFNIESIKDKDENEQKRKRDKINKIIEYENYLISNQLTDKHKLKQYFIENSFNLFYKDLNFLTEEIFKLLKEKEYLTDDWENLNIIDKIFHIFIKGFVDKDDLFEDYEFFRLKSESARNYYHIHINNRKKSLKENIQIIFKYLQKKRDSPDIKEHIFYIGSAYGEIKYRSDKYFNELQNYKVAINLKGEKPKTDEQLINYSIVKLKIEDDFISFKLNKFIVFLYDFKIISKDEYHKYVYGTTNESKIELTKFGLNIGLIDRLQKDGQLENLDFDQNNNLTSNKEFKEYLTTQNDFQRFEIERFLD